MLSNDLMKEKSNIARIQRFSIDDGPGIRTTVFFKGCPLRCRWCHNPECIGPGIDIQFRKPICVNCGACVSVCPANAHCFQDGKHVYQRDNCQFCLNCVKACWYNALEICGESYTVDSLFSQLLQDLPFFRSGGGVTLSGGEPLLYCKFCSELIKKLKSMQIHIAIDTCGHIAWENMKLILEYADLILYDIKCIDGALHKALTTQDNQLILDNFNKLCKYPVPVWLRIPLIAGLNDNIELMIRTADYLEGKRNIEQIDLIPYHSYGVSKYESFGIPCESATYQKPALQHLKNISSLFVNRGFVCNIRN